METNYPLLPTMEEKRDGENECKEAADISVEGHLSNGAGEEDCKVGPMKDVSQGLTIRSSLSGATGKLRERCREKKREKLGGSMGNEREVGERKLSKMTRSKLGKRLERQRTGEEILEEEDRERDKVTDGETEGRYTTDAGMEVEREGDAGMEGEQDERRNPWKPSPHPILSRMLLHSSTASSTASFNASSAESDEVFSEDEDVAARRNTMRKCRSWRTFLTMMHWSIRRQSSWVQLAGHQGNFQLGEGGEVLKLFSEVEATCLQALMADPLRLFVPQYHGVITRAGLRYLRLEDLLTGLKNPVIMDCKMGVRTYQIEEMHKARTKPTLRTDMYQKIVKVDPTALSAEEHEQQGVTKWHYLQWRDTTSSSSTLGFRIEGIMMENGKVQRDFRRMMSSAQVTEALLSFTKSQQDILRAYYSRLQALGETLRESPFFKTHEVIGSSLLFVHDNSGKASIWMIDFGKTTPVPSGLHLTHNVPWAEGNREDGYLIGLASLTSSLGQAITQACPEEVEQSRGGMDTCVHLQEHSEEREHRDEHLYIQEHNPN
ncbi:inositol-trisphosphate 3-kinase A [Osmerus mordax]|uniref:inositol-trisphosphate 3-kinase A n=1 Tax=Osmerus mordax TaxID=8014 RepID=UPI00350EA0AA